MAGKTVPFGNPRRPAPEELDAFVHGNKPAVEQPAPAVIAAPTPLVAVVEEAPRPAPAPKVPMKRLTFDIPATTHMRMKLACVGEGKDMAEELRAMIEQRWPAP
jgi:hypothetical protein